MNSFARKHKYNSSISNLTQFVNNLHPNNGTIARIDPFNNFECTLTFVEHTANISAWTARFDTAIKPFIVTGSNTGTGILDNSFHALIEDLTLPNIIVNGEQVPLMHGKYHTGTVIPLPADNTFTMTLLNTAPSPIIETVIYPWLQEMSGVVENNTTALDYPRADFTIVFPHLQRPIPSNMDINNTPNIPCYMYHNVRPVSIELYNPSNKPNTKMYRTVTFTFDYFTIKNTKK